MLLPAFIMSDVVSSNACRTIVVHKGFLCGLLEQKENLRHRQKNYTLLHNSSRAAEVLCNRVLPAFLLACPSVDHNGPAYRAARPSAVCLWCNINLSAKSPACLPACGPAHRARPSAACMPACLPGALCHVPEHAVPRVKKYICLPPCLPACPPGPAAS